MKTFATAAVLAAFLAVTGSALAADKAPTPTPAPAPQAKAEIPPLTDDSLLIMLRNMGYEPQIEKTDKGNIYTVTIKRGTWTYIIDVSLSPSKTKLWFSGWLSELPKDKPVPADKLLALLEGSWTHGPCHFRYHRAFNQLNIGLCLDNRDMSPAAVRTQLEGFMDTMKKTELLWNVKKWSASDKVVIGESADKKAGK